MLETGSLGRVYLARFFYGNGTAADVRRSEWRDRGLGVLPDLGSHLLDMALFLFGPGPLEAPLELWAFDRFENRSCDHVLFGAHGTPALQMEATLLSWRNTFHLDLYGEHGSAHINCLCKWGPSSLTVRRRVLPSGKPTEEVVTLESPDPTWALEYTHFKALCQTGGTNLANDVLIAEAPRSARPGRAGRRRTMIGFAGLSHLGLVSGIATASKGFDVVGFDTDKSLAAAVGRGDLPVFEPGLAELFQENRGRLRFTADPVELRDCDIVVFAATSPPTTGARATSARFAP